MGHLSLCVLDAVLSIGARYTSTVRTCRRYADAHGLEPLVDVDAATSVIGTEAEQALAVFVGHVRAHGAADFAAVVLENRQRTSTGRSGVLKAEAALLYAEVLIEAGIERYDDVPRLFADDDRFDALSARLRAVPGNGISDVRLGYLWMLLGNDDGIKPDRMVRGCGGRRGVAQHLGPVRPGAGVVDRPPVLPLRPRLQAGARRCVVGDVVGEHRERPRGQGRRHRVAERPPAQGREGDEHGGAAEEREACTSRAGDRRRQPGGEDGPGRGRGQPRPQHRDRPVEAGAVPGRGVRVVADLAGEVGDLRAPEGMGVGESRRHLVDRHPVRLGQLPAGGGRDRRRAQQQQGVGALGAPPVLALDALAPEGDAAQRGPTRPARVGAREVGLAGGVHPARAVLVGRAGSAVNTAMVWPMSMGTSSSSRDLLRPDPAGYECRTIGREGSRGGRRGMARTGGGVEGRGGDDPRPAAIACYGCAGCAGTTRDRIAAYAAATPVASVGSITGAKCGEWLEGTGSSPSTTSSGIPPKNQ